MFGNFLPGPKKRLFRLFFTFFQSHSHHYAPEKTSKTAEKDVFLARQKFPNTL